MEKRKRVSKYRFYYILFFGVLLNFNSLFAEENWKDEILNVVETNPDSAALILQNKLESPLNPGDKAYAYMLLTRSLYTQGLQDSAAYYAEQAMSLLNSNNNDKDKAIIYKELTSWYKELGQYKEASIYGEKARALFVKIGDDINLIKVHFLLAFTYDGQGKHTEALTELLSAADIAEHNNYDNFLGSAYLNMGNILAFQKLYKEAIEKYEAALDVFQRTKNLDNLLATWGNLGKLHKELHQYPEAIQYLSNAQSLVDSLGDILGNAHILMTIGSIYLDMGEIDSAQKSLKESLKICNDVNFYFGKIMNNNLLSKTENNAKNYLKALQYAREAIRLIGNKYIPVELVLAHKNLHRAYAGLGNYKESLNEFKMMTAIQDSVKKEEDKKQILEMTLKYETEKKEQEIENLKQLSETEAKKNRFVLMSIILVVLFLVAVIANIILRMRLSSREVKLVRQELDFKNNELKNYSLNMAKMSNLVKNLEEQLTNNAQEERISTKDLIASISESERSFDWDEFELKFNRIYPKFNYKLTEKFPNLSLNEQRLAMLIRLNLYTKEIAYITNKAVRTIESERYHLRKKMNIGQYDNLVSFIQKI